MKPTPIERHKRCGTDFCSLHKAAPDLVEALLWFVREHPENIARLLPTMRKHARAALRAAGVSE